jgi:hypothetical protein
MLFQGKNSFMKNINAGSTDPYCVKIIARHCRIDRQGCSRAILLLPPLHLQKPIRLVEERLEVYNFDHYG